MAHCTPLTNPLSEDSYQTLNCLVYNKHMDGQRRSGFGCLSSLRGFCGCFDCFSFAMKLGHRWNPS